MINILIWLLLFMIVAGVVYYVLSLLPLPDPFKKIAMVIFLLIVLLVALAKLLPMMGVSGL